MNLKLLFVLIYFYSELSFSKTLIVTDIDDTIKIAHVLEEPVSYATEYESRFKGMSDLYHALLNELPDSKIVYLTNAYSFIMKNNHKKFLSQGGFPKGELLLRSFGEGSDYKKVQLRNLIHRENPDQVILLGDNGEMDIDHYDVIAREFKSENIQFYQYVRILYSPIAKDKILPLRANQVGFVTPIEIVLNLKNKKVVSERFSQELFQIIGSEIMSDVPTAKYTPQYFPNWMRCEKFEWPNDVSRESQIVKDVYELVTHLCASKRLFSDPFIYQHRFKFFKVI